MFRLSSVPSLGADTRSGKKPPKSEREAPRKASDWSKGRPSLRQRASRLEVWCLRQSQGSVWSLRREVSIVEIVVWGRCGGIGTNMQI